MAMAANVPPRAPDGLMAIESGWPPSSIRARTDRSASDTTSNCPRGSVKEGLVLTEMSAYER